MHNKFHEYVTFSSKLVGGRGDRQTDDMISLLSFLESRIRSMDDPSFV
jgi:hypothetical protein